MDEDLGALRQREQGVLLDLRKGREGGGRGSQGSPFPCMYRPSTPPHSEGRGAGDPPPYPRPSSEFDAKWRLRRVQLLPPRARPTLLVPPPRDLPLGRVVCYLNFALVIRQLGQLVSYQPPHVRPRQVVLERRERHGDRRERETQSSPADEAPGVLAGRRAETHSHVVEIFVNFFILPMDSILKDLSTLPIPPLIFTPCPGGGVFSLFNRARLCSSTPRIDRSGCSLGVPPLP